MPPASASASALPFTLDPFQIDAIAAIAAGRSVLVSAPTGSGKTLIAYEAIDRALTAGQRAVYTTPVKALSNQKYLELCDRVGESRTGLLTGDRSIRPTADVVVMTTEVLRALLLDDTRLLDGVTIVVLDEFHYLQDPERGAVWEEIVMASPRDLVLVCLSATLPDVQRVHRWISDVHPPTALIVSESRPVPLHHNYAIGNLQGQPPLVMPMFVDGKPNDAALMRDGPRRILRGEGLRVRDRDRAVSPTRSSLVEYLAARNMLPAIWFVLSRAGCDRAAVELVESRVSLNTPGELLEARAIADRTLAGLSAGDLRTIDAQTWRHLFESGIAVHHSGHLPVQREAVETAFAAGLLKLVFATETLAVGVNLPARTVVLDRVTRPDGQARHRISGSEFAQLAGRAGRRGLDVAGHVVVPWNEDAGLYEVIDLALGRPVPLVSHMQWTPALVAGLAHRFDRAGADAYMRRSLAAHLAVDAAALVRDALEARQRDREEFTRLEAVVGDEGVRETRRAEPAAASPVDLADLEPGDVVVDPGIARPRALLVLERQVGRKGEERVTAVGADARVMTLTARDFRRAPVVAARLEAISWDRRARGQARHFARLLAGVTIGPVDYVPPPVPQSGVGNGGDVSSTLAKLDAEIDRLRAEIARHETMVDAETDAMVALLTRRGHLDGFALTPSGDLVRRIFHPQGLLIAECLAQGVFDDLRTPSLVGVLSAFRAATARDQIGRGPSPSPEVRERVTRATEISRSLNREESDLDLPLTVPPDGSSARALSRWADGAGLDDALEGSQLRGGDFVREVRQTIELLDQVAKAAEEELRAECLAAIDALDRDAVRPMR